MSENETIRKGGISVETEHIFPIIKKWLYSEKEIFLREIVSNACDAITKHKRLTSLGHIDADENRKYRIDVRLNTDARTITVSDNGIGMTAEEVEKYICSIALSGALDFIQKYEGEGDAASSGIIGHFGLGFYSSFMVSNTVEVVTRSYSGDETVGWRCFDSGEYEIFKAEREENGTDVIMHVTEDEKEYLSAYKLKEILNKYCAFMPVEIYFTDDTPKKDEDKKDEKAEEKPINDVNPLWLRPASEITDDQYKEFYKKLFGDWHDPLFWIHINADYPLNFKGILFFPKIANEYQSLEGQVKLYYNQVFVADNIKEAIPEYMLMLKGVLDCPELPLNVSRSYLQTNSYMAKMTQHISKKVSDKLNSMMNTDRAGYEKIWNDIKTFIEYGCIKDKKFSDRLKDAILFKSVEKDKFYTLPEYLKESEETNKNVVYYTNDPVSQAQYIEIFKAQGIKILELDTIIDMQYVSSIENDPDKKDDEKVKFVRVDSGVADALKGEGKAEENKKLEKLFKEASGNKDLTVEFEALKDTVVPAMINTNEESRRFEDMMKLYGMGGESFGSKNGEKLIVNTSCPAIQKLEAALKDDKKAAEATAKRIYMLALLANRRLTAEELSEFLKDSYSML